MYQRFGRTHTPSYSQWAFTPHLVNGWMVSLLAIACGGKLFADTNWPMFRGADGSARVSAQSLVETWSQDKNIRWQVDLPGPGSSSPIVWGDRVLVTSYRGFGVERENPGKPADLVRVLTCLGRDDGRKLWEQETPAIVQEDPYEGFITDHGYASSTPATNGQRVFAFYGKSGVLAFDLAAGKPLWQCSVGTDSDPARWGSGASPILHKNLVIVNAGNEGDAIVAIDQSSGKEVWRHREATSKNCWSTPLLVDLPSGPELVVSIPSRIVALDPQTGEELWFCESPIESTVIPSVIAQDGVIYSMGSRAGQAIAIRCGGRGDIAESHVLWKSSMSAGICTPVIVGNRMYWATRGMVLSVDLASGQDQKQVRMPSSGSEAAGSMSAGSIYASPIAVGSRLYFLMRNGTTHLYETAGGLAHLSANAIANDPGPFDSTPAVAGDALIFRSVKRIYCVAQ